MKIAIASGKGGTGKTTLTTNLASYLAERNPVVLVDLDVEEPNSGLFFSGEILHIEEDFAIIRSNIVEGDLVVVAWSDNTEGFTNGTTVDTEFFDL